MKYFIIMERTLFFYIIIACLYRFMGKREIGELSIMDFIVSIFIAELAAIAIENYDGSIFLSLGPITVLTIVQIVVSRISYKNSKFRNVVDGEPSMIINRGKINFSEMLRQRYNLDDLLTQLRAMSIKSIEEVDYAILETSGKLSIFKREDDKNRVYPLPVIIDGKIQDDVLVQIGKDKKWLLSNLKDQGYTKEDIYYGFYKKKRLFLIKNDTIK